MCCCTWNPKCDVTGSHVCESHSTLGSDPCPGVRGLGGGSGTEGIADDDEKVAEVW